MDNIRIFIVDDHKILAHALLDYLNTRPGLQCEEMAHSGEEALRKIPQSQPDIVLLDIGMPEMDGIECCKRLLQTDKDLKIIGLSTHAELSIVKSLFKAGAKGYISKNAEMGEIIQAIQSVYQGKRYIGELIRDAYLSLLSDDPTHKPSDYHFIPTLTQREQEILDLIAEECTTDEIAERLCISKNTVQTHRKNLISKLGVRNSVGLVLKALELKLI